MRLSLSSNFILSLILINTTIITVRMFAYINDICQKKKPERIIVLALLFALFTFSFLFNFLICRFNGFVYIVSSYVQSQL